MSASTLKSHNTGRVGVAPLPGRFRYSVQSHVVVGPVFRLLLSSWHSVGYRVPIREFRRHTGVVASESSSER